MFTVGLKYAESQVYPINNVLFNIERSRDASQIVYQLDVDEAGLLNTDEPIKAYWVRYKEDGRVEPITWIQKELSYGLKFTAVSDSQATFHFACYNDKSLFLRNDFGSYKVYAFSQGKFVEIERIYVHFNGGTDWLPTVEYVKIFSREVESKEVVEEIIYP